MSTIPIRYRLTWVRTGGGFRQPALTFGFLIWVNACFSQSGDSIPRKVITYAADRFLITRVLNLEYGYVAPYRFTSRLQNSLLPENKVTNLYQAKLNINTSFIRKTKWMLGATLNYRYTAATTQETGDKDFHYHSTSLNFTYFSKLFNKMTIYSGSLLVDGSEQHFERLKGLLTGTMVLKTNARTRILAGLVLLVDPSVQLPVIPTFSYEHRFTSGWTCDIVLPQRVLLKKDVFNSGRLSLGSELGQTSFYLYDHSPKYEFRQTEINSGVTYEQLLGNYFAAILRTGIRISPSSRIFEKKESSNHYVFEANPNAAFYCTIGLSFNPFMKKRKK